MKTLIYKFNTRNFSIYVHAVGEANPDLWWTDDETLQKIDNGELSVFGVAGTIYFRGIKLGSDFLGECVHESISDFKDHFGIRERSREESAKEGKPIVCGSYFYDMIRTLCEEARASMRSIQAFNNLANRD